MIADSANVNTANLYNKFSHTNLSSNKQFLAATYSARPLPEGDKYYNQDSEKQAQKKKIKRGAAIGATVVATGAVIIAAIASGASNKNMSKLLDGKNLKEVGENIKHSSIYNKITSFMANINPVKDDAFERVGDICKEKKIPILKHIDKYCDKTKGFYRGILRKFQKGSYEKAAAVLRKEGIQVEAFDDWFDKVDKSVLKNLKGRGHFTEGMLNKDLFKKMTTSNIADDILSKDKGFVEIAGNITAEVKSKEAKAALESLNKTRNTVASKLRDIDAGSAATDFITMGVSAVGLGTAIATSDTKEEKKSIAVNLGIPLLTTLSCNAFLGNIFAISGAKSLLFSLAAGQLASKGAKLLDKKVISPAEEKIQNA